MQGRIAKLCGTSMRFVLVALVASVGACATEPDRRPPNEIPYTAPRGTDWIDN